MTDLQSTELLFPADAAPTVEGAARHTGPVAVVAIERSVDRAFDYAVPPRLVEQIDVGQRVRVPLGRGNKSAYGYVVEIKDRSDHPAVKAIFTIDDDRVLLRPKMLELARWIARYYVSPLGMVLESIIPSAVKKRIGLGYTRMVSLAKTPEDIQAAIEETKSKKRRTLLSRLLQLKPDEKIALHTLAFEAETKIPTALKLRKDGFITITTQADLATLASSDAAVVPMTTGHPLNAEQAAAVDAVCSRLDRFSMNLLFGVTGSGKTEVYLRTIEQVVAAGKQAIVLVPEIALTPQTVRRFVERFPHIAVLHSALTNTERHQSWQRISSGQSQVIVGARSAVFAPTQRLGLIVVDEEHEGSYKQDTVPRYNARDVAIKRAQLEGVPVILGSATPSLETWANVIAAENVASEGATARSRVGTAPRSAEGGQCPPYKTVAPGDSAAHSLTGRLEAHPGRVEALPGHPDALLGDLEALLGDLEALPSRLEALPGRPEAPPGHLEALPSDLEAPRTRLEALASRPEPLRDLGTVSGKPDAAPDQPRTGPGESATTPGRPEAVSATRYLLRLPSRVRGLAMPKVEVIDMRQANKLRKGVHLIGMRLESLMKSTFAAGEQAILLLNRRGYANCIFCSHCNEAIQCKYCDTTMTYHRAAPLNPMTARTDAGLHTGQMHCHYCLAVNALPATCPQCGKKLSLFGLGTQRVEEELKKKFPDLPYARVDSDTMRSKTDYEALLGRFGRGEIKLMLGTQMIAKGLDYPNVTLVGVISGDTALNLPDFRAAERTFQLVTQVAGRAGRGDKPGRVVLQTFLPEDPSLQAAVRQDYEGFAEHELNHRRAARLPPDTRMVRVVLRDTSLEDLHVRSEKLATTLNEAISLGGLDIDLRGPMPCPIERIAGYHRAQIVLTCPTPRPLQRVLAVLRKKEGLVSNEKVAVDVDPVSML